MASKPIKTYAIGAVSLSIFRNERIKADKTTFVSYNGQLQKSYQDSDGNWQHTASLSIDEMAVGALLLAKATDEYMTTRV